MTKAEQLTEYIIRDIIEYHVANSGLDVKEAMSQFYNSELFDKLNDIETGLYLYSSSYIYDLFSDELKNGKFIQLEI